MTQTCNDNQCGRCGRTDWEVKTQLTSCELLSHENRNWFCSDECWAQICQPRKCLKCRSIFGSTGPFNRFCKKCTEVNARIEVSSKELEIQRGIKSRNGEIIQCSTWNPDITDVIEDFGERTTR